MHWLLTVQSLEMNRFWRICDTVTEHSKLMWKLMSAELMHYSANQTIVKCGEMWLRSLQITTDCTEQSVQLITFTALYPFWDCHERYHAVWSRNLLGRHSICNFTFRKVAVNERWRWIVHVLSTSNIWPYVQWLVSQQSLWLSCWGNCTCLSPVVWVIEFTIVGLIR